MAPEHVKIVVETRSLCRHSPSAITGKIWLEHGPRDEQLAPFPEAHWIDFPVVILQWWLQALAAVDGGQATCRFMDGPYEFIVHDVGGTLVRVRCLGRGIDADVLAGEFETPAHKLHSAVRLAAEAVLKECERRGWKGIDIEKLRDAVYEAEAGRSARHVVAAGFDRTAPPQR